MRLFVLVLAVAFSAAPALTQDNDVLDDALTLAETPPSFVASADPVLDQALMLAETPPSFEADADPISDQTFTLAEMLPAFASAADPILEQAITLAETPPAFTIAEPRVSAIPGNPVSLLIAAHRTGAERHSDTHTTVGIKRRRPIAVSMRLRRADDANFTNRTRYLARRIEEANRTANLPLLASTTTGAEFLDALVSASREGPISNLVVYGHAAPNALFMREDRGFYASVADVARASQVVSGGDIAKHEELYLAGARDLSDFELLVKRGAIRFTRNAVIVFAGCGVAGKRDVESDSIAARMTALTGAKVIASVDVTDQSMARGANFRNHEYSRRTWVRFVPGDTPQRLNTKVIDALQQLHFEGATIASVPQPLAGGSN